MDTLIVSIDEYKDPSGYYYFQEQVNVPDSNFFQLYKSDLGLGENDSMMELTYSIDELGIKHEKYNQFYKGIRIKGANYTLHSIDGFITIAHGKIVSDLNLEIVPTISEIEALNSAKASIDAIEYAWDNEDWETGIKIDQEDSTATYFPSAELIICKSGVTNTYHLTYKFSITTVQPSGKWEIYVDAHSGKMIKKEQTFAACNNASGSFTGMYTYGYHSINVRSVPAFFNYRLHDCTRGEGIIARWGDEGPSWGVAENITDDDGNWGTEDQRGTTPYWCAQQAYDYYGSVHNHYGSSGNDDIEVRIFANYYEENDEGVLITYINAKYEYEPYIDYLYFGEINGHYAGACDIVGHEFTHGVCKRNVGSYNEGFDEEGEPKALEESFGDIFGTAIERYTFGLVDWLYGDDDGDADRSLSDPPSIPMSNPPADRDPALGLPAIYNDPILWYTGSSTIAFPYVNMGVQEKWFYLLVEGGTFNGTTVSGLGFDKAINITFRSVKYYMQHESNYTDARAYSIQAAKDLYGNCSNEVRQVMNAWRAVGIGKAAPNLLCVTISGPEYICEEDLNDEDYTYVANVVYNGVSNPSGIAYSWLSLPTGWTASGTSTSTLLVTNMSSSGGVLTVQVTYTATGKAASDNHIVSIENCDDCPPICDCPPYCRLGENDRNFSIFPNPSSGMFSYIVDYKLIADAPLSFKIYSFQGALLYEQVVNIEQGEINMSFLANGSYLLMIEGSSLNAYKIINLMN